MRAKGRGRRSEGARLSLRGSAVRRPILAAGAAFVILSTAGCDGPQSALNVAGEDAATLSTLFYVMLGGAVVLWIAMNGLFFYVTRMNPRQMSPRLAWGIIFAGGVGLPTVVLAGLLSYGLSIMPDQRAPGDGVRVEVTGEQWWFRVRYFPQDGSAPIEAANQIVLPTGSRSELTLKADRVIHSLWIPSLAGKTDMIPGRTNRMSVAPTEAGVFRGQCAEFCGESHALMAFTTVTLPPDAYADWLAAEAAPAAPPQTDLARAGRDAFLSEGCGACHAVRGTPARGRVGPDLTHLGSRETLAAGTLPMTEAALIRWIRDPAAIKPGAHMPAYDHLDPDVIAAMAAYLEGLE